MGMATKGSGSILPRIIPRQEGEWFLVWSTSECLKRLYYEHCAKAHAEDTRRMKAAERWRKAEEQRKEMAGVANGAQPSPDGVPGAAAAAAREPHNY